MVVANVTLRESATIILKVEHDDVVLLYAKFDVDPGSVWAMCGRALWDMSHGVVPKRIPREKHDHQCKECRVSLPPPTLPLMVGFSCVGWHAWPGTITPPRVLSGLHELSVRPTLP